MPPRKLTAVDSEEERARWKIVRRDTMADVPGLIMMASVDTGLCVVKDGNNTQTEHNFGPGGLAIVIRKPGAPKK